jgi:uncharacterized membrane protein
MNINNRGILIVIGAITLILFPVVAFTTGALQIVLGLPFVLFRPGYALISTLFPRQSASGGIEQVALSFGISVVVVPIIGLALNYTPWGIRLYPILISVAMFIILVSATAYYRQQKLPEADRLRFTIGVRLPDWAGRSNPGKALSISLLIAILAATGCLVYIIAMPKQGEKFTEFYMLGLDGKAEGYPREAIADQLQPSCS